MSPFLQVSRMFYEWREALKVARKQTQLIDGQIVNHYRRVKQGCMGQWKKFTLKNRADKHCNKTITAKVGRKQLLLFLFLCINYFWAIHLFYFCHN